MHHDDPLSDLRRKLFCNSSFDPTTIRPSELYVYHRLHQSQFQELSGRNPTIMGGRVTIYYEYKTFDFNQSDYININQVIIPKQLCWIKTTHFSKHNNCKLMICLLDIYGFLVSDFECRYIFECDNYHENWPFDRKHCSYEIEFEWKVDITSINNNINDKPRKVNSEWKQIEYKSSNFTKIRNNQTITILRFDVDYIRNCRLYVIFVVTPAIGMFIELYLCKYLITFF